MTALNICLPDTEFEGLTKVAGMLGVTKEYIISLAIQDFVSVMEIVPEYTNKILKILNDVNTGAEKIHLAEDVYKKAGL